MIYAFSKQGFLGFEWSNTGPGRTLHIDPGSFILMLAILPTAIALLLMYFVDVDSAHRRYNKKFLDAFAVMAVSVAGYLMVVIIFDQVFVISSSGQCLLRDTPAVDHVSSSYCCNSSQDGIEKMRMASSSTALVVSGKDMSSHKENLNLVQAMCKLDFWLLFLAMACGMGSGLATVNNIRQIRGSFGYTSRETSTLVSLWSIWNFSGRFSAGYVSDHFLQLRGVGRPFFIGAMLLVMDVGDAIISSGFHASVYMGSGFQRCFYDKELPQGVYDMTLSFCYNNNMLLFGITLSVPKY